MPCSPTDPLVSFNADQRILVTGASSGIGEAIALQLNALGAIVIANGRNTERLEALKEKSAAPASLHIEPLDLTANMPSLAAWVTGLRKKYGKLSGLAHCAGVTLTSPLREYDLATARTMFDLLFHAPMLLAQGFADRRNNTGKGANMVFIAAASAVVPTPSLLIYSAAKGALITAVRNMSKELSGAGIRVNCISPALVDTPMRERYAELLGEDNFAKVLRSYPLGLGEPDDVASAAAYLLSSAARWVTGQNLLLTGG